MTKVCLLMLDLIFSVGSIGTRGRSGFRGVPLAQNSNVFQRQADVRPQFGVIDVDEPLADSFLTRIVAAAPQLPGVGLLGRPHQHRALEKPTWRYRDRLSKSTA